MRNGANGFLLIGAPRLGVSRTEYPGRSPNLGGGNSGLVRPGSGRLENGEVMRKYQKAAVVMAMLGSVSFLGAGVGHAGDDPQVEFKNTQTQNCEQNDSTTGLI